MYQPESAKRVVNKYALLCLCLFFPAIIHASFIESTLGTAVVNDATASYYNPAALTLLTRDQLITIGSLASSDNAFRGQAIQSSTGFTQTGHSTANTHFFLPSLYLGMPTTNKVTLGLAVVSNFVNRDIDGNSILRYAQSSNSVRDADFVPALGIKLNDFFSLGAGISISNANFLLEPVSGIPSLNIPDAHSRNESTGTGLGGDVGFLFKANQSTTIGFNYRSAVTYKLHGTSILETNPEIFSNDYRFTFWTPARSVLSINHFITKSTGFIATVQRIQWSIFNEGSIYGIAGKTGDQPVFLNAKVPYHLHDSWLFTVGSNYRPTPKWIIRIAGNYNQAPDSGNFQISNGDSVIFGTSMGYEINKNITIDASIAHTFVQNQTINIITGRNIIRGENSGSRNAFSLKLTLNQ